MRPVSVLLFLLLPILGMAQSKVAQVLEDVTEVDYVSPTNVTTHHRRTVMVYNAKGLSAAEFYCSCNASATLTKFSGEILNATRTSLKKVKKSDLKQTEYSPHLASDAYYFFYSPTLLAYPAIVTYEWTEHQTDAVLGFDVFCPMSDYDVAIDTASYTITCPQDVDIKHSLYNIDEQLEEQNTEDGKKTIRLVMNAIPPIRREKLTPALSERLPMAYFSPDSFTFKGTKGSLASWQEYGVWNHSLLEGRDVLSEDIRQKVHSLTDGLSSPLEKVRALYNYLAETTRYVSIQLGIGGMQPEKAENVGKLGFGDCKGLSNYLSALLKEVGIPSTYVVIGTRHQRLPDDYANVAMLNHAILQVALPDTTLWLECTNPQLPMGYVHQYIAGHDAILITDQGGQKVHVSEGTATQNRQKKNVVVHLQANASASIEMTEEKGNAMYEEAMPLLLMTEDKQKEAAREAISLPDVAFHSFKTEQGKDENSRPIPLITTSYTGTCGKYASISGERMLIPINPFTHIAKLQSTTTREAPVQVANVPTAREWNISLSIPEGYEVESLPEALTFSEPWCTFNATISQEQKELHVHASMNIPSIVFKPEEYAQILASLNKVAHWMNSIVVITKK